MFPIKRSTYPFSFHFSVWESLFYWLQFFFVLVLLFFAVILKDLLKKKIRYFPASGWQSTEPSSFILMLKVHLPSINPPRETSIITCINIVPFSKVQTHSNFKTLSKLKFLQISLVLSRLALPDWPGYKLSSSRSRTPSDRFCSPACCASGTRTWPATSSSDTPNILATKRDFIWVGVQSSSCQCQCPQLRWGLQGITFGFQDYWDKAWESQ